MVAPRVRSVGGTSAAATVVHGPWPAEVVNRAWPTSGVTSTMRGAGAGQAGHRSSRTAGRPWRPGRRCRWRGRALGTGASVAGSSGVMVTATDVSEPWRGPRRRPPAPAPAGRRRSRCRWPGCRAGPSLTVAWVTVGRLVGRREQVGRVHPVVGGRRGEALVERADPTGVQAQGDADGGHVGQGQPHPDQDGRARTARARPGSRRLTGQGAAPAADGWRRPVATPPLVGPGPPTPR